MNGKIGHWAFVLGVLVAIFAGLIPQLQVSTVTWVLVALGLVVGLLNITAKETQDFLIASVALIIASSSAASLLPLGFMVVQMLSNIVTFVFPAALIVALKAIWSLAQD